MNIEQTLNQMTLEDKVALGSGKDFWHTKEMPQYGIEPIMVADGPHGLRKQPEEADMLGINNSIPATSFPTASLTACSFDEKLLKQMGKAIAMEAKTQHISLGLHTGAVYSADVEIRRGIFGFCTTIGGKAAKIMLPFVYMQRRFQQGGIK